MNDTAERIGVYAVSRVSAQLPGVIFREQRSGDTGLNAHLELTEDYPRMGKTIGLQIRSDENIHLGRGVRGYICRGEMSQLAYWLQHAIPVLVMVYDRESDQIFWEFASDDTIEIDGKDWELLVPHDHVYGTEAISAIAELPCYSPYLSRLALDRPWMELIESGRDVVIEMEEWINQPATRGTLKLCVVSPDGTRESVYDWVFQTDSDMPHVFRLPSLFPWAGLTVDENFYRQKEIEPPAIPSLLRPWMVEAGEIARFQLKLSLNELGKSFLFTERFLRRGEFPKAAVVSGFDGPYESSIKYRLYKKI